MERREERSLTAFRDDNGDAVCDEGVVDAGGSKGLEYLVCCLCCFDDILVCSSSVHYMVYYIIWREWLLRPGRQLTANLLLV